MNRLRFILRVFLCLATVGGLVLAIPARAATKAPSPSSASALGTVVNSRVTRVSGIDAVAGNSIFSGDTFTVGPAGAAWLSLRGGAQARIGSKSQVRLTLVKNAIQFDVLKGEVILRSTPGGRLVGRVADGTFVPASDGVALGQITFDEGNGRTQFAAERGNWTLATASSGSAVLHSGESMAAQVSKSAGHVAVVVAKVYLARGKEKLDAKPDVPVFWGDVVNTVQLSRARIALNDGSVLNVGPQSSLEIVKENAAAQQTDLDLVYGHVRSKVVHLTKPNSSFKIHTRLGVAGVVGTDFYLGLEGNSLQLVVFEGIVRFCNLAGVCVNVRRNQHSMIMIGMAPTTPTQTPKGLLLEAENSTKVPSSVAMEQKPAAAEVNQQSTSAEAKKKKRRRQAIVVFTTAGLVGAGTGIVLSLGPSRPRVASPVVP